jgi:hypothetical protein
VTELIVSTDVVRVASVAFQELFDLHEDQSCQIAGSEDEEFNE